MKEGELFEDLDHQLKTQGYAIIDLPLSQRQLRTAQSSFKDFLTLPGETKQGIFVPESYPGIEDSIAGYVQSKRKQGSSDNKQHFHYNQVLASQFSKKPGLDPKVINFFNHAEELYHATHQTLEDVFDAFETQYSGIKSYFFPEDGLTQLYNRYIQYEFDEDNLSIAKPHLDRGGFTMAIYESKPGLRLHHFDGQEYITTNVQAHPNKAIIFPGYKLPKVMKQLGYDCPYQALAHDVIIKEIGKQIRNSTVTFLDPCIDIPVRGDPTHFAEDSQLMRHLRSL